MFVRNVDVRVFRKGSSAVPIGEPFLVPERREERGVDPLYQDLNPLLESLYTLKRKTPPSNYLLVSVSSVHC